MNQFPTITTDRLLLRQLRPEDIHDVFRGLSHPDVIKYYGVSYQTLEDTQKQMDWFAAQEADGTGLWWAVCSRDNSEFYGTGGLTDISKEHRKGEIGFWLLPEYWGRGIMGEAFPLIVQYGFEEMDLHRIEGFVEHNNQNCQNALRKVNFKFEGTMRDCEVKDGKFISVDIWAALNPIG